MLIITFSLWALSCLTIFPSPSSSAALIPKRDVSKYNFASSGLEWDTSCDAKNPYGSNNETKREAIDRATKGMFHLIEDAWDRFTRHSRPMLEAANGSAPTIEVQKALDILDPAYTQLFKMDWSPQGMEKIGKVLNNLGTILRAAPGQSGRPPAYESRLKFGCDKAGCSEDAVAWTSNHLTEMGAPNGTTINLCDKFFSMQRFDKMEEAAGAATWGNGVEESDWKGVRDLWNRTTTFSDAQSMLHEVTHLWWIAGANSKVGEAYGIIHNAVRARDGPFNNPNTTQNADSYGWYAEYGYWSAKLGFDIWHADKFPKIVKVPIQP